MGNVSMEARDINYRGGETKMSVEEALKSTSGEAAAIAALQEAVGNLQTDTGNLQTTKANLITIAPVFSEETAYDPGDLVYNNGLTYRCTNAHEGEWDADDFAATTIDAELKSLNSKFTDLVKTYTADSVTFSANGNALTTLPITNKVLCALIDADTTSSIVGTVYKAVGGDGYVYGLHAFRANSTEDLFTATANVTVYYI